MKKQVKSNFSTKFHLLNSQENTNSEVIIWTSSDSSDYENNSYSNHFKDITKCKKRKRITRKKVTTEVSCLNISFTDNVRRENVSNNNEKSIADSRRNFTLPVRNTSHRHTNNSIKSPILPLQIHNGRTSPVLPLKVTPQKHLAHVKKNLFSNTIKLDISKEINKILEKSSENHLSNSDFNESVRNNLRIVADDQNKYTHFKILDITKKFEDKINIPEQMYKKETVNSNKMSDKELANKIKSYFSKDLTSDPSSQQSNDIECYTSQSSQKTSLEITNITQEKIYKELEIPECTLKEKTKKIKYKKDGLAYRLSSLVKKQNANISLWHHERFLAANSNFLIPKGEFTGFRILKVHHKYDIYLLDCKDVDNEGVLICINNFYVNNISFQSDMILKLYMPYKAINLSNMKLIVNVSKFECKKW